MAGLRKQIIMYSAPGLVTDMILKKEHTAGGDTGRKHTLICVFVFLGWFVVTINCGQKT